MSLFYCGNSPKRLSISNSNLLKKIVSDKNVNLETVACKGQFSHFGNNSSTFFGEIFFSPNGVLVNFTKKMAQDIYRITSCYNSMTQIAEFDIFTGTGR